MRYHQLAALALALVGTFATTLTVRALINPNFTPVHLVRQSALIAELQAGPVKDGKFSATVKRVLAGKYEPKTVQFNLSTSTFPQHIKLVEAILAAPAGIRCAWFVGGMAANGEDPGGGEPPKGYLHIAGTWILFAKDSGEGWAMKSIADSMGTTWNGGTDMLLRAVDYVLSDPAADVPVKEGVRWGTSKHFATLAGPVHAALPLDLAGDGRLVLHITGDNGDHLFKYDPKAGELVDVTAALRLAAKSKQAAWGCFNGGGRPDLVSWDGAQIVICTQASDGTFKAGETLLKDALPNGCLSLAVIASGRAGHPAVLIGTATAPLLWCPDQPGGPVPVGGASSGAELGAPGLCLAADLDGDGVPDVIQFFEKGSLIYRGKALGQFEPARRSNVALGPGRAGAFFGDYDADGRLDILTVCADGQSHLWCNQGNFEFLDTMNMTGELAYKGQSGALGGCSGDFNNDGRQDVFLYYAASSPHLYFNRGFRSFGLANGLHLPTNNLLPQAEDGQQAGCLADLTGSGAQVMILVLNNGECWAFYVEAGEDTARCVRAVLPSKGPYAGPLTVTGWRGTHCLGAWNVMAGTAEAFFGVPEADPVTLKWQLPGGKPQQQEVLVENVPVRVSLTQ